MNNEQDILRRAQQGDSEAFRLLVEAYQTQVYLSLIHISEPTRPY